MLPVQPTDSNRLAAVGGLMRYSPTPGDDIVQIVQWRARQNKTANTYLIEIAL